MRILNIKTTCFQGLERGLDLPSFLVKSLCPIGFIERYYDLKFRRVSLVDYFGRGEVAEFAVDPNNLVIKGVFIDFEVVEQPRSLDPVSFTGYLDPKVPTYTNMVLDV